MGSIVQEGSKEKGKECGGGRRKAGSAVGVRRGHTHERYGIPQACNLCVRIIKGRVGCDAIWKRHKICGRK